MSRWVRAPTSRELKLPGARNRARQAVEALTDDEAPIAPGLLVTREDLKVLLDFTELRAAEVADLVLRGGLIGEPGDTPAPRRRG